MSVISILAAKEIKDGLRNRWVMAATLLLAGLSLSLTYLGSLPSGSVGADPLAVAVVGLSSLTIYLVPLIALLLSYDAMVGEVENGTMVLLLSYPVARWQVMLGKFLGHLAILAFATIVGYGCAGVAIGLGETAVSAKSWWAFAAMMGSSVMLGAAFIALGYLVSVMVSERGTAAGVSVAVWLFFVLLFDLGVLGLLTADKGQTIAAEAVQFVLLLNPADIYRLFNLSGLENVRQFSGLAGVSGHGLVGPAGLLSVLGCWIVAPLMISGLVFRRREL